MLTNFYLLYFLLARVHGVPSSSFSATTLMSRTRFPWCLQLPYSTRYRAVAQAILEQLPAVLAMYSIFSLYILLLRAPLGSTAWAWKCNYNS